MFQNLRGPNNEWPIYKGLTILFEHLEEDLGL